ncbi:MAG: alpha-2-macroglobulin family protein [Anaerolineae bacterium]
MGFYNAYREPTQLFLTHMNVSRIDLSLSSVALEQFIAAAAGPNYYDPTSQISTAPDQLLRSWSIDSTTPENVYRYELLDAGAGGGADCTGRTAIRARWRCGDCHQRPRPVARVHAAPDGEVRELLYRDYRLPVVSGPQCIDGIVWWEVRLRDESTAWVAEGVGGEYFLDLQQAGQTTPVQVTTSEGGALAPGIYYLTAQAPELGTDYYQTQRHLLVVATANLVMKTSTDSVMVWAADVQTRQVISDAPITIYDGNLRVLAQGTTDASGMMFANIEWTNDLYAGRVAVMRTDTQFGIAVNQWTNGIDPWTFGQNFNYYPQQYRVYAYTDRPIYRPGQPVYFRGVVRTVDDVTYTPSDYRTVPVVIFNDQGEIVYQQDIELTPYGTFSGQFDIDPNASLGYYQLRIDLPNINNETTFYNVQEGVGISFGVAEYRLPEFQVNVTPETDAVVQGDTIRVTVDSRYFFGGAVSNATVEYNVNSQPYYFNYTGSGYFSFADFDYDAGPQETFYNPSSSIASGTVTTDAQGQAVIEIPADLGDNPQSQTLTIEAVVTDESQQAVAGRAQVIVHQGQLYVGAAPEEYVGVAGQDSTINFVAVDWDSNGIANQTLNVEVVERRWSSVQEQDENGRTTWTYEVEEIPVTTGTVTTDEQGRASFTFTPPNGGIFKVKVSTTDAAGNRVNSATTLWVSSREYVSWRQQNSNRIDLIADNTSYEVGDTAEILITSPFQGTVQAWVTVERGDVLHSELITMDSNSYVYTLPITDDFAPNVYVSVFIVKGVDDSNTVAGFRMGMVALNVDNERKNINIEITPNVEQAGPGDTVTYTVRTTDYAGNPVQAEVGVGLTDLASLSIADSNSQPILDYFYGPQGLGVRTASALTINTDQLTQETLDTIKGGGGGFGEGGIFDIRENFVDTAYWNGTLVTDANGVATFDVTLPDNLTTWRLDARAVTMGSDGLTLVGQDTFDLISTKPLLVRPVTPRFFVVGDEVTLAAVVNNNTGADMNVRVTLQASGVTFVGDETQTMSVPSGGRQRFEWQVVVTDVQNVELIYFADGNDGAFSDASRPPLGQGDNRLLPVYRYCAGNWSAPGGAARGRLTDGSHRAAAEPRRHAG